MIYRLANVIYWLCAAVAVLCLFGALGVAAAYFRLFESTMTQPDAIFVGVCFAGFAFLSWLTGRTIRYILAGI